MTGRKLSILFRFQYRPRIALRLLICLALLPLALVVSLVFARTSASGHTLSPAALATGGTYGMRQYYLTKNWFPGNQARNACASGFHFASIWEIADPSSMLYNTTLGLSGPDSGASPPTAINFLQGTFKVSGWVRTGYISSQFETVGQANCQGWLSDIMGDWGTTTGTIPEEINVASAGPFRGELGDATEGSIRTVGMVKWAGQIDPGVAYGMFSIMDFLPTFASLLDTELPGDRPIDGVDQANYLLGKQPNSNREHMLTFLGNRLAGVRWHQWRMYTFNTLMSDNNPSMGGYMGYMNETNGFPMAFNIEADLQERRNVLHYNSWLMGPFFQTIGAYKASLKDHPNIPSMNLTMF